jgi:Mg-chelatase subunit ChlD
VSNLPANPLQNILKRAAQTLPATTGKVAQEQERLERRRGQVVILADISASMAGPAWGGQRKIDILREAVAGALQQASARLFVFSGGVREVRTVPEPEDNTNLAGALLSAQELDPGVTLVISDGHPDNAAAAIEVAQKFRGVIDVLYIGPETDSAAISFMKRLAAAAGGDMRTHDVARLGGAHQLLGHIAGLLR